jgi:hypothetical protein
MALIPRITGQVVSITDSLSEAEAFNGYYGHKVVLRVEAKRYIPDAGMKPGYEVQVYVPADHPEFPFRVGDRVVCSAFSILGGWEAEGFSVVQSDP